MKKEMVISSLTIYAIAFSCVTLLVGKSFASTSVQTEVVNKTDRKNHNKILNHVKPEKINKDSTKVLQSHYAPSNNFHRHQNLTVDDIKTLNGSHSYFALYDPIRNETRKFEVIESIGELPSDIPTRFFGYDQGNKNGNDGKKNNRKRKHPWDKTIGNGRIRNFISRDTLKDSETEIRVHYNGISAKETTVKTGIDEETGQRQGLKLRQLTDGFNFIQLIYSIDDVIQDCEFIRQKKIIHKFLNTFRKDVGRAKIEYEIENEGDKEKDEHGRNKRSIDNDFEDDDDDDILEDEGTIERYSINDEEEIDEDDAYEFRNVTFQILQDDDDLPGELAEWMDYQVLKAECKRTHRILKKLVHDSQHGNEESKKLAKEHFERVKRGIKISMIAPGTKWCGRSQDAERYTELGGFSRTDQCCRAHDHCHPLIPPFDKKYDYFNFRPFTLSHCRCDRRKKRDLMDVFRVPGTKWCGKGKRAVKYTSLGGFSRADKCCREHDTSCPYWIGGFEEKYGLFNWRINTIMHCKCDKRFRACLKMAKTGAANLVGKLFFNVVQTKCFVLKPHEVCLKTSWWGKCEKKEYKKRAYLKDNIPY